MSNETKANNLLTSQVEYLLRETFYDGVCNDRYSADHNQPDYAADAAKIIALVTAAPKPDADAGNDLDADMTLAYMKGWQDGQDAIRKSVDAAVAKAKGASDDV